MVISIMTVGMAATEAPTSGQPVASAKGSPPVAAARPGRKFPVRALIPVVLVIAGLAWWWLSRPAQLPPNVIPVSGRIEGDDSAIATKPGGRVLEITVREGDSVKQGQLIAVVDDAQVRAREDQARDALRQSEAQMQVQRRQIPVLEQQLEQGRLAEGQARLDTRGKLFQAQQQVIGADANILQSEAKVRSARRQIAVLQQQREQSRLAIDQAVLDAKGRVFQAEEQVAAAEASLAQARAQHHQADVDAARYAVLASEDALSAQAAEQSRSTELSLRAGMDAAQRQVESARGALTVAQANLANPGIRRSQETAVREQITASREDLTAALADVKQMRAVREQAEGGLIATRADLSNPAIRISQEAAIREQIAQAQASLSAAQEATKQARAKLDEAQADRKDLRVLAPFNGTVATRVAEPGEVLAPGATVITLVDMSKVYLRGYIPEGQIGHVKLGQEARVYLDSAPTAQVPAFVSRIDPEASFTPENTYFRNDRVTQVVGVKLQITGAAGFAKPGMPADGEVLIEGAWPAGSKR